MREIKERMTPAGEVRRERFPKQARVRIGPDAGMVQEIEDGIAVVILDGGRLVRIDAKLLAEE